MSRHVFLDNKLVLEEKALISINTHALHYGCGYFAGIRGYWNNQTKKLYIFRLDDHIKRFINSGKILGLKQPRNVVKLKSIIIKLLKKNRFKQNTYIRPIVYVSDPILTKFDLNQLNTTLAVTTVPMGHYLNVSKGITVMISSWVRQPADVIPPQAKPTGIYLNTALAHTQAKSRGFDEAILLTQDGYISEGSAENIFIVKNKRLITPDISSDILVGITRKTVIKLATRELGVKVTEKKLTPKQVLDADEVFLTGTGAEITPVRKVNQKTIGSGNPGPITSTLQGLYFDIVKGKNRKYLNWLTPLHYN